MSLASILPQISNSTLYLRDWKFCFILLINTTVLWFFFPHWHILNILLVSSHQLTSICGVAQAQSSGIFSSLPMLISYVLSTNIILMPSLVWWLSNSCHQLRPVPWAQTPICLLNIIHLEYVIGILSLLCVKMNSIFSLPIHTVPISLNGNFIL